MNKLPTEACAIVGALDPQSLAAGTVSSAYISMALFRRFLAILQVGAMTASSTVDAKLVAYTSSAGANPTDITGCAITQLTQASSDSNKQVEINLNIDRISKALKFTHFRLQVTVATAASLASAVILGFDPRYAPASDNDAASVDEITNN